MVSMPLNSCFACGSHALTGYIIPQLGRKGPPHLNRPDRCKEQHFSFHFFQRTKYLSISVSALRSAHTVVGRLCLFVNNGNYNSILRNAVPLHMSVRNKRGKRSCSRHFSKRVPFVHHKEMCIRQLFPTEAVPEANICIQEKILPIKVRRGKRLSVR